MDRQTDRQTNRPPQAPTQPGEHRGGNHLAENHWWWWQRPWRRKSKASGRALHGRAQSPALSHHSKTHRHTPLGLYPHVHLNSAYSTDVIAYVYICLLLSFDTSSHHACHIKLGQENERFSSNRRKKNSLNAQIQHKRKAGLTTQSCAPIQTQILPKPPRCPSCHDWHRRLCHCSGDKGRWQWVGRGVPPHTGSSTQKLSLILEIPH